MEATGAGSTLTLVNLATVTEGSNSYAATAAFEALSGGTVSLPALHAINTGTVHPGGPTAMPTVCSTSRASPASPRPTGWTTSTLQATNSGRVNDAALVALSGTNLTIDGGSATIATAQVQSFAGGSITINGGRRALAGLTSLSGSSITVSAGGTVSLPGITGYAGNGGTTTFEATGTGTTLTLANLANVTEGSNSYAAQIVFEALAAMVNLTSLQTINTGTIVLKADEAPAAC